MKSLSRSSKSAVHEHSVPLSSWVELRQRYTRSINLDRDLDASGTVSGYVLTDRARQALMRVVTSLGSSDAPRAFTVTGVYGTGKSAFAHFLASLLGGSDSQAKREALAVLKRAPGSKDMVEAVGKGVPAGGFLRAVAMARQEPLGSCVARALLGAIARATPSGKSRKVSTGTLAFLSSAADARIAIDNARLKRALYEVADGYGRGIVLIIDELGKVLEHCAETDRAGDLFLLQELAEGGTSPAGHPLLILGLLHQSFSDYGDALHAIDRAEWQKIQGRFEDIVFFDSTEQTLALLADAVTHDKASGVQRKALQRFGHEWYALIRAEVSDPHLMSLLSPEAISAIAPIHPVAALILPRLCSRFAQNERSLFTYLTSGEAHSFARFIRETYCAPNDLIVQRLSSLYDYFVDVAGTGLSFRPQYQRWAEVHGTICDAGDLGDDFVSALKTIGLFNLVSTSGPLRASQGLIIAALSADPVDKTERKKWEQVLDSLVARGLVTYRKRLDDYRLWEGSDLDIEAVIREQVSKSSWTVAEVLAKHVRMGPLVAHRHSYESGTLRYFERAFTDAPSLQRALDSASGADGFVFYWTDEATPPSTPETRPDGRPIVLIHPLQLSSVRHHAFELAALRAIATRPELQSDGVARRELIARTNIAERELGRRIDEAFDISQSRILIGGKELFLRNAAFNTLLSRLCDETYPKGIKLWNEHINRKELTSAGSRARREVLAAMLTRADQQRLAIEGDGPEASIYDSVLFAGGVHKKTPRGWEFGPPGASGINPLWVAIEDFCVGATAQPRNIAELFQILEKPPYGIRPGVIPVILAAVLLHHADEVSLYCQGTFVPTLGSEHFELLVKAPEIYSVKYFRLTGLRREVFRELEGLFDNTSLDTSRASDMGTGSVLRVVRPLIRFCTRLPQYTRMTTNLSPAALAVRHALLSVREPDELIFKMLPEALGLGIISEKKFQPQTSAAAYRKRLHGVIKELDEAYERLLDRSRLLIHAAMGAALDPVELRDDLRVRAQSLVGCVIEPKLQSIVLAMVSNADSEREWLEALVMVIADKPADAWTDSDELAFEMRLGDFARRFRNLYALVQAAGLEDGPVYDARRITITHANGHEQHQVVWLNRASESGITSIVSGMLAQVERLSAEQQLACLASLTEAILSSADSEPNAGSVTILVSNSTLSGQAKQIGTRGRRRA